MLGHVDMYDALYLLAADDGREAALFGDCQPLAREAFSRSQIGEEFPTVCFEVPLLGKPRFDLHVAISRAALRPGVEFAPGAGGGYDGLFRWYAEEETGGDGLGFAYDVSEGCIDAPAMYANVNNTQLCDIGRFFELAAGGETAKRYRAFESRLPQGWHLWYTGFFPCRPDAPVRVGWYAAASRSTPRSTCRLVPAFWRPD